MAGDRDRAGGGQGGPDGGDGADGPCDVDWAAIATGLSAEKFGELSPQARRMALVERSARFAVEFGRWKDDQFTEEEQQKFYVALGCLVEVMHGGGSC